MHGTLAIMQLLLVGFGLYCTCKYTIYMFLGIAEVNKQFLHRTMCVLYMAW